MGSGGSFAQDALNVASNIATAGLVGFDGENNGFSIREGVTGNPLMEGTKEITGANAAEEANELARQQYEEAQVEANQQQANQRAENADRQIRASNAAASARRSNRTLSSSTSRAASSLLNDETDFLGL